MSAQNLIRILEDNSLSILAEAVTDVRASSGTALRSVSDDDLKIVLYTVLLKVIDVLRDKSAVQINVRVDTQTIFVNAVRDMMDYIDGQSSYTAGHTRRVVEHVVKMASCMGLPDEDIDRLEMAAWVHNIGLISQSQKLDSLPRTLTQDELKMARNHTVVGAEILRPIEFMAPLVPIVRYHHTRYDASQNSHNEPKGDAIPLGARLICIADAYQAMLEPRAYRPPLSRMEALLEIEKGSGTQFDPALVPFAHEL
jgi:HD-GYP domain-containing protein (c-di-GMP phosphodiesterase class II)